MGEMGWMGQDGQVNQGGTMRIATLLLAASVSISSVAFAQQARPHVSALLIPRPQAPESSIPREVTRMRSRESYWLEGAIGGGVLLGAAGFLLVSGLCDDDSGSDNCTSDAAIATLSTATAGGVIGAFIGKTIPTR